MTCQNVPKWSWCSRPYKFSGCQSKYSRCGSSLKTLSASSRIISVTKSKSRNSMSSASTWNSKPNTINRRLKKWTSFANKSTQSCRKCTANTIGSTSVYKKSYKMPKCSMLLSKNSCHNSKHPSLNKTNLWPKLTKNSPKRLHFKNWKFKNSHKTFNNPKTKLIKTCLINWKNLNNHKDKHHKDSDC